MTFRRPTHRRRPTIGTECPNDGTTLEPARGGLLHCPFDGWIGTAEQAEPPGPVFVSLSGDDPYPATYAGTY